MTATEVVVLFPAASVAWTGMVLGPGAKFRVQVKLGPTGRSAAGRRPALLVACDLDVAVRLLQVTLAMPEWASVMSPVMVI